MKKKVILSTIIITILCALCIYNALAVNPKQLKIDTVVLTNEKISEELNNKTILFFSDLYYGELIDEERVDQLITTINRLAADVVIFGGDLGKVDDYIKEALKKVESKNGLFFVSGETDGQEAIDALTDAGFIRLDENIRRIHLGADDYIILSGDSTNNSDNEHLYIEIAHQPDKFANASNSDYVFAGHSLGGQVYIPLINLLYRPDGAKKYYHGHYVNDGRILYITNGVGLKENTIRFLADGEIKLFRLTASH